VFSNHEVITTLNSPKCYIKNSNPSSDIAYVAFALSFADRHVWSLRKQNYFCKVALNCKRKSQTTNIAIDRKGKQALVLLESKLAITLRENTFNVLKTTVIHYFHLLCLGSLRMEEMGRTCSKREGKLKYLQNFV